MLNGKHRQPVPGPLCASYAPVLPVLDDLADMRLAAETRAHLAECAWCRAQRVTYDRFDEALRLHFAPDAMPFLPLQLMEFSMSDTYDNTLTDTAADGGVGDDDTLHLTLSPLSIPPRPPRRSWRLATGAASLAAVLVISLLAGLIFVSHGRPQSATTGKATPTSVPGSPTGLSAIGMSSATDGWAMGNRQPGGNEDRVYAQHYTGGRWVQVQTGIRTPVNAIKMLSPTDGWTAGSGVYHYDGASWREVNLPLFSSFNAISAVSPNNVWVAGDGVPTMTPGGTLEGHVVILHYDGYRWTQQSTPTLLSQFSIYDISMISATEGWAVGTATPVGATNNSYVPPTGAILHYSNGAWQLAKTLPNTDLRAISMGSANDGWIGGDKEVESTQVPLRETVSVSQTPLLLHYTGGAWVEVNAPRSAGTPTNVHAEGQITSISMFSATQGWMAIDLGGETQSLDKSTPVTPDMFRLEQGRWVQVKMPIVQQRRSASMSQVEFLSPDEFWGVGNAMSWDQSPTVTPLIVHYKNGSWSVIEK